MIDFDYRASVTASRRRNDLLIEEMSRRLILIRPAFDQTMAQVSARDYGNPAIDIGSAARDSPPERDVVLIRPMRESDDGNRAAPPGLFQIVERDQRPVVQRVIALQLSKRDTFVNRGLLDRIEQLDIV